MPRPANAEVRKFLDEVATLSDPIEPGFVRDFQKSTLAQPVPPEFFETVVGEALKVPAHVWKAALQPYRHMDFSADTGEDSRCRRCWYGVTVTRSPDGASRMRWPVRSTARGSSSTPALATARTGKSRIGSPDRSRHSSRDSHTSPPTLQSGEVPPLTVAVWKQQTDDVRRLLQEGADPNQRIRKTSAHGMAGRSDGRIISRASTCLPDTEACVRRAITRPCSSRLRFSAATPVWSRSSSAPV